MAVTGSIMAIGSMVTGISGANSAKKSSSKGQRRAMRHELNMFKERQALMQPYINRGYEALGEQAKMLGLGGYEGQQEALNQIQESPIFQGLIQQQENAILQNASATGGLRGGNTQDALMRYRPQLLNQQFLQRFNMLGGITGGGQSAVGSVNQDAAGVAQRTAQGYQNLGNIQANAAMARANAIQGGMNTFGQSMMLGKYMQQRPSSFGGAGSYDAMMSGSQPMRIME